MRIFASLSLAVLALALVPATQTPAQAQAVAQTPPMGWNSWNFFAEKVTDKDIRAAADNLVATGMKDAGYIYINIDDTWEGQRDASGILHTNAKFPDMKALADYVHSKGLKIGIYSGPGPKTCGGFEGSLGHEAQDAQLYASWGIDYLKYDMCSFIPEVMEKQAPNDKAAQMHIMYDAYAKMDKALKATGRPIVFSLCQYGWDATSRPTGTASTPSSASRPAWKNMQAPATGTIPTCSRWETASSPWPRTAPTFRSGLSSPRPCWPATTCPT